MYSYDIFKFLSPPRPLFLLLSYDALDTPGYLCHRLDKNAQGHHGLRPARDACTEENRNVANNFCFT